MKYIKKPVEIEAYQVTQEMIQQEHDKIKAFPSGLRFSSLSTDCDGIVISWYGYVITIHEQETKVVVNDWIITEPDGVHFYPCKPDIFKLTYDKV